MTHFTQNAPTVPCPSIPDQMVRIEDDGTISGGSNGTDGGWPRDEVDVDSSACSSTLITEHRGGERRQDDCHHHNQARRWVGLRQGDHRHHQAPPVPSTCSYEITLTGAE